VGEGGLVVKDEADLCVSRYVVSPGHAARAPSVKRVHPQERVGWGGVGGLVVKDEANLCVSRDVVSPGHAARALGEEVLPAGRCIYTVSSFIGALLFLSIYSPLANETAPHDQEEEGGGGNLDSKQTSVCPEMSFFRATPRAPSVKRSAEAAPSRSVLPSIRAEAPAQSAMPDWALPWMVLERRRGPA